MLGFSSPRERGEKAELLRIQCRMKEQGEMKSRHIERDEAGNHCWRMGAKWAGQGAVCGP